MSTLYQRSNGIFYVRLKNDDGTFRYVSTGATTRREAEAAQRRIDQDHAEGSLKPKKGSPTVGAVLDAYLDHARAYYCKSGRPTSQVGVIEAVVNTLREHVGDLAPEQVGPLRLRQVRDVWVREGLSRSTVNAYTRCVVRIFRWAAAEELLDAGIPTALATVPGLPAGRGLAKEGEPVEPVDEAHVEKVKDVLPAPLRALVDLQLLTAARPGELVGLRPCDLDTSGPVWVARLSDHKTAHKGKGRELYFGPKAQDILRPFLLRPAKAYLFSPKEAIAERAGQATTHRREDQPATPRQTERRVGDCYTPGSYRQAIQRACEQVNAQATSEADKVPLWHPHQLRHTAATKIRREYSADAAQVILGHSSLDVTQVYAEVNRQKGMSVIAEIG